MNNSTEGTVITRYYKASDQVLHVDVDFTELFIVQMADASLSSLRIAKLNGSNYQTWKFKVELLLIKEDLWDVVSQEPPEALTPEWRAKDRKARASIGLLLEDSQLHLVRKEITARATWNALKQYHEKSTLSNKASLLRKLCA